MAIILSIYVYNQYKVLESPIKEIQMTFNSDITYNGLPTVYISSNSEQKFNFEYPYKFKRTKDSTFSIKLSDTLKLRRFRCYFEFPGEKVIIYKIDLISEVGNQSLTLNEIREVEQIKKTTLSEELIIDIEATNGFFSNPKRFLYKSDFVNIHQMIIPLILIIALLGYLLFNLKRIDFKSLTLSEISLSILIISIFLPAPIYNVALILVAILNIKKLGLKNILAKKINLIIISFFFIYLINNLFLSDEGYKELSTIDRFLPFLILALFIPPIATKKFLGLFPLSAIVIGFGLLMTSIFDVYVHQNLAFVSFNGFTKYLHPIYYSYLLFFSITYINHEYHGKLKYPVQLILFVFLIFSGSKIVLLFTIIALLLNTPRNKKAVIPVVVLGMIILFFSPLNNRFKTIFKSDDLSILNESHLADDNDARINGLTIRLMLWREALSTMSDYEYLIGKGVSKNTNKKLSEKLSDLGLDHHKNYQPHNQYVDTFWRTGLIGLLALLAIPLYSLIWAIKSKEIVLVQFSILMLVAMLTENIFGRVNGIYFFTLVILLIINSKSINEHSDFRH